MIQGLKRTFGVYGIFLLAMAAKPLIGGQAVIEGVMMRSPKSFTVAVRRKDGVIVLFEKAWASFSERFRILKLPILRGANMLVESIYNGLWALQFSAEQAMQEEDKKSKSSDRALLLTMMVSLLIGIALFKAVPHFTAYFLGEYFGHDGVSALPMTAAGFHLVDGVVKLGLFIGYILIISRMNDVKRLFMYHGAEHKSVHVWEKNLSLIVDEARLQSTAHPRCGTSLILLVLALSIVVFAVTIPFIPVVSTNHIVQTAFALAIKIPLMLPIAGIAYELQRLAAKYPANKIVRFFIAPGMLMQRLTTREPTDDQLEIALSALRKAVWREQVPVDVSAAPDGEQLFSNFAEVCVRV